MSPRNEIADEEDLNIGVFIQNPEPAPVDKRSPITMNDDSESDESLGSRSCIQSFSAIAEEFVDGEYQSLTSPKILVEKVVDPCSFSQPNSVLIDLQPVPTQGKRRITKSHEQTQLELA